MPIPIVTGSTMATIDRAAAERWGVSGLFLMERAGESCAKILLDSTYGLDCARPVVICGGGNNGGDGFVIARRLVESGMKPAVLLTSDPNRLDGNAKTNHDRLLETGVNPTPLLEDHCAQTFRESLRDATVVVDAILGTGISGAARGAPACAINQINARGAPVLAVDIASGVVADTGAVHGSAVTAAITVTFGLPKIGQFLPPGINFRGDLVIQPIGFPSQLLEGAEHTADLLERSDIAATLPRRSASCHKGTSGHLCVIAGSRGMSGAALLCARAAYQAGAGLVTLAVPASLVPIAASSLWESLLLPLPETTDGTLSEEAARQILEASHRFSAAVVGPGLSQHQQTTDCVRRIVREIKIPLLIDADGLNVVRPDDLRARKYPWAATPHPGELARLLEASSAGAIQQDRWGWARQARQKLGGPIALKGAATVIAPSEEAPLLVNPTGGPAMASGGMGDVLSGIVGALLAQGVAPVEALCAGVYLHGLAADLLVRRTGFRALLASDVSGMIQSAVASVLD